MAESYFELLTEQSGMPAKPFDPVGELKRLRRGLAIRMQSEEPPKAETNLVIPTPAAEKSEPSALEAMVNTVGIMQKKLAVRQRYRFRRTLPRTVLLHGNRHFGKRKPIPDVVAEYLMEPQGGKLEILNAGLTALGIIGIAFGVLSFCRGWESDLSLGTLVCVSGFSIIGIGLGGRLLASRYDFA